MTLGFHVKNKGSLSVTAVQANPSLLARGGKKSFRKAGTNVNNVLAKSYNHSLK